MREHEHSIERVISTGALIAALLATACRPSPDQEPELEAIDVGPALEISIDDDQTPVERPPELIGILPDDFPEGLPLYLPASLVDFGTADNGWYYVNLLSPHAPGRVERELTTKLSEHGWAAGAGQLRQGREYRNRGRRVKLSIADADPGTRYRFDYPP